jgi:hypothetical protein
MCATDLAAALDAKACIYEDAWRMHKHPITVGRCNDDESHLVLLSTTAVVAWVAHHRAITR